MKKWNFQTKSSPKEITERLESSLGRSKMFVLNMNSDKKNLVNFKIRKRVLAAFGTISQDQILVKGRISKGDTSEETGVEISFTQHPILTFLLYGHLILGLGLLAGMFFKISNNSYIFIVGGILLAIGVLFKLHQQREFDKNVQDYKKLISEILEI